VTVDPTTQINFKALSTSKFDNIRRIANDAFAVFERAAPEIGAEIRSLLTEIVFVSGASNESLRFDGATSFFCWGAIFLNAEAYCGLVKMIAGLTHESAHAYLFALSLGDAFVDNPDDELHPSPLRADPRPLDGTFHATYVCARMHYALNHAIGSGVLSRSEESEARTAVAASCAAFSDGFKTLSDYASVTALGRRVMGTARSYMIGQAGVQL
jgi:HEXXH motif-containing protein